MILRPWFEPGAAPKSAPDHQRFVFYSDGRAFFCPEPWCGEPDSLNTGRGVVSLAPGERFCWELRLSVLDAL